MKTLCGYCELTDEPLGIENNNYYLLVNCCGHDKFVTRNFVQKRELGRLDFYLLYVINGKITAIIDNDNYNAIAGDVLIIKPNQKHHIKYQSTLKPETYWIHFTGYGVTKVLSNLNLNTKTKLTIGLRQELTIMFDNIIKELQIKQNLYINICEGYIMQLLALLSRCTIHKDITLKSPDIQKVITLLHEKYNEQHTIASLSKYCLLTPYRFIHKFKNVTGYSPMQYLCNIRISNAKNLLLNTTLNISEISEIVGYHNPLYFSRIFKKQTGISPSKYRVNN